jgi:hypothetical protein
MLTLSRLTALAAVVGIASLGTEGTLAAEAQVLKVVERATADAVTDTGAEGDSAGDLLTFANGVFDEANATQIGTDNGWCIRTAVGQAWECAWTMTLADGQINVSGPFLDNKDSVLTVTGGTGSYAGVSGEMLLHARNPEGTEYDFVYKLMR